MFLKSEFLQLLQSTDIFSEDRWSLAYLHFLSENCSAVYPLQRSLPLHQQPALLGGLSAHSIPFLVSPFVCNPSPSPLMSINHLLSPFLFPVSLSSFFLPSFLPSFLPFFLSSFLPSFLPPFLPFFPSFLFFKIFINLFGCAGS